jgi:1-phosphofructokinase family hexose kinase
MIFTVTPNPVLDRTLTVPRIVFNEVMRATSSSRLDWGGKGFNVTDVDAEQYIKVNEAGPTVQALELAAFFDRAREKVRSGDIWVLSGTLPPNVPPDFYAQLIALVQARGAKALLDSSGEPLRLSCAAGPYLVKPNVVEAEEVTGREISSDASALGAVEFFLHQGIELVALSLGAGGLLLASKQRAVWARPPHLRARNPVGAGDALLAGIAWALKRGLPLEEMARWAVATGTAAAVREGVSVGTRAEVETLYEQVRLSSSTCRLAQP